MKKVNSDKNIHEQFNEIIKKENLNKDVIDDLTNEVVDDVGEKIAENLSKSKAHMNLDICETDNSQKFNHLNTNTKFSDLSDLPDISDDNFMLKNTLMILFTGLSRKMNISEFLESKRKYEYMNEVLTTFIIQCMFREISSTVIHTIIHSFQSKIPIS
tara:strand:+ start:13367 stop:13840 length:474 start_codon:yes stop_codon:yes gene_type:complete